MRFFSTEIDGSGWSLVFWIFDQNRANSWEGVSGGLRGVPRDPPGTLLGPGTPLDRLGPGTPLKTPLDLCYLKQTGLSGPPPPPPTPRVPGGFPGGSQGGPRGVPGGSQGGAGPESVERHPKTTIGGKIEEPPWTAPGRGGPRNLPARAPDPPGGYPPDPRKKH